MDQFNKQTESAPNQLRRRLFRGVPAGVGVLLAVQAKTALGGVCQSPSAMMSGNTSPRPGTGISCYGGRSPGYWKQPQHSGSWVAPAVFPTFSNIVNICAVSGQSSLLISNISNPGTTFAQAGFGVINNAPSQSIWAALAAKNQFPGNISNLLFHCVAAWLNAVRFNTSAAQYPLTPTQVIAMWTAITTTGLYCPSGSGCTPASSWDRTQVISYIEGLYSLGNEPTPDLCVATP